MVVKVYVKKDLAGDNVLVERDPPATATTRSRCRAPCVSIISDLRGQSTRRRHTYLPSAAATLTSKGVYAEMCICM